MQFKARFSELLYNYTTFLGMSSKPTRLPTKNTVAGLYSWQADVIVIAMNWMNWSSYVIA